MNATFQKSRTILAILFLGVVLAGCNRESADTAKPDASGSMATPGMPATPPNTAPAPAPAPAPDTPTPPSSSGAAGSSDMPSTASNAVNAAGTAVEDTVITGKVKAALLADTKVKGLEIKVETKSGDVTLSGTVDNQAQIDNALEITRGIDGVKNVDNKMTVKAG